MVCIVHLRDSKFGVRIIAGHGERAGLFAHIGVVHAVFVRTDGDAVHGERHMQRLIFRQMYTGGCSLRAVILRGESLLGVRSPAPRGTALCALGDTCSLAFRGAGLRVLRRTRPRALREVRHLSIGTHADFVGLVGGQVFGIFRFLAAHGQRHVDGGCFSVQIVAEAGVLPLAVLFLIDRHAVAVGVVHLTPFSPHHLVADKFQLGPCGSGRLVGVRISDSLAKLLAVDGHKSVFSGSALKGKVLFRH